MFGTKCTVVRRNIKKRGNFLFIHSDAIIKDFEAITLLVGFKIYYHGTSFWGKFDSVLDQVSHHNIDHLGVGY